MRRFRSTCSATVTLAIAVGSTVAGLCSGPPSAEAATRAAPASRLVTRSAHISYLSCRAPDVLLTASVQRGPFAPGQPVTYKVSIRNLSQRPCGYENRLPGPTNPANPAAGLLGPCGELPVVVVNSRGDQVYPGPVAFSCPAILGPSLGTGKTITTTGTWDPAAGLDGVGRPGFAPGVPPGDYHIVIDGKVALPVDLAGPSVVPEPPGTLPPPPGSLPPRTIPTLPVPTLPPRQRPPHPLTTTPSPPGHPVTRSAHVAFDGCARHNVTLTVTIPAGPMTSAPVHYDVVVRQPVATPSAAIRSESASAVQCPSGS